MIVDTSDPKVITSKYCLYRFLSTGSRNRFRSSFWFLPITFWNSLEIFFSRLAEKSVEMSDSNASHPFKLKKPYARWFVLSAYDSSSSFRHFIVIQSVANDSSYVSHWWYKKCWPSNSMG